MELLESQDLRATGGPEKSIIEAEASILSIATRTDISNFVRVPLNLTHHHLCQIFGANVVPQILGTGHCRDITLRYKNTGKPFPLSISPRCDEAVVRCLSGSDPLGVKVINGIYSLVNSRWEFELDSNRFLDLLGFRRDGLGYHRSNNVKRLQNIFGVLEAVQVPVYRREKKKRVLAGHEPFIQQIGAPTIFGKQNYRVAGDPTGRYTFIDKRWLKEDSRTRSGHGYTVLLHPYFVYQWAIGWHQHQGVFKRNLPAVFRDVGIPTDPKHFSRTVHRVEAQFRYMEAMRYIGSFSIERRDDDRLILTVEAPENHPIRTLRRKGETC